MAPSVVDIYLVMNAISWAQTAVDGLWTDSGTGTAPPLVAEVSVHWFLMVWVVFGQSGHWSLVKCVEVVWNYNSQMA